MLPLPGAPASSWPRYKARLRAALDGTDPRTVLAFWLFGLINNVLYVIILSAALDLVGPAVPKGVVLLADVLPSFLVKLLAPYAIQGVSYHARVLVFAATSALGMLLVAHDTTASAQADDAVPPDPGPLAAKLAGIVLASAASGGGELSFLSLTHHYGPLSLAAWGSGTGAAGLIGAGAYALVTTVLQWSVHTTLLAAAGLPAIMLLSFFSILPRGPLGHGSRAVAAHAEATSLLEQPQREAPAADTDADERCDPEAGGLAETEQLLAPSMDATTAAAAAPAALPEAIQPSTASRDSLATNLRRARRLVVPYMLPLLLVYVAEYTINQGVAPTLLFPLASTPFQHYRAFYPAYNAIYQAGVFISRSSTPWVRVRRLYLPAFLQVANLTLLTAHAVFNFLPSVWVVFLVVFWEGLLGGAVYVNTFAAILEQVPRADREFSLGATSVSDSGGICIAGFLGMILEVALCRWQVQQGRDYCRQL